MLFFFLSSQSCFDNFDIIEIKQKKHSLPHIFFFFFFFFFNRKNYGEGKVLFLLDTKWVGFYFVGCITILISLCLCLCLSHIYIYIYIIMINKYILDFIYLMPWKFVCDLRFHEVLQTIIVGQIMKENEEIKNYSQKPLELCTNLCVLVSVRTQTHLVYPSTTKRMWYKVNF